MHKLAFFYPAKIVTTSAPMTFETVQVDGQAYCLGKNGERVYFSTEKARIVREKTDTDKRQIFLLIGEHYCQLAFTFSDGVQAWIEHNSQQIKNALPKWTAQLANPELYEQQAAETRAKIRAEREARDREQTRRIIARHAAEEAAHKEAVASFKKGEAIAWTDFERACKDAGVTIPLRTLGMGRRSVGTIGTKGGTSKGARFTSSLWRAVRELAAALAATAATA